MRMKAAMIAAALVATTMLAPAAVATAETTAAESHPADVAKGASTSAVQAAGSPVFNYRRLVLEFPPERGSHVCKSRDIYLAADWYYWRHEDWYAVDHQMWIDTRRIRLAAGWYHWKDCIGWFESAYGDAYDVYHHDTYLRQKATGGYAHLDRVIMSNPYDRPALIYSQFGSSLRRL